MLRNFVQKRLFSFIPDRATRFFSLRFTLGQGTLSKQGKCNQQTNPIIELLTEAQTLHQHKYEQSSAILLGGKLKDKKEHVFLFQSENQIEPHTFLCEVVPSFTFFLPQSVKSPFWKEKLIKTFSIQEVQVGLRIKEKELAPKYLRE